MIVSGECVSAHIVINMRELCGEICERYRQSINVFLPVSHACAVQSKLMISGVHYLSLSLYLFVWMLLVLLFLLLFTSIIHSKTNIVVDYVADGM